MFHVKEDNSCVISMNKGLMIAKLCRVEVKKFLLGLKESYFFLPYRETIPRSEAKSSGALASK